MTEEDLVTTFFELASDGGGHDVYSADDDPTAVRCFDALEEKGLVALDIVAGDRWESVAPGSGAYAPVPDLEVRITQLGCRLLSLWQEAYHCASYDYSECVGRVPKLASWSADAVALWEWLPLTVPGHPFFEGSDLLKLNVSDLFRIALEPSLSEDNEVESQSQQPQPSEENTMTNNHTPMPTESQTLDQTQENSEPSLLQATAQQLLEQGKVGGTMEFAALLSAGCSGAARYAAAGMGKDPNSPGVEAAARGLAALVGFGGTCLAEMSASNARKSGVEPSKWLALASQVCAASTIKSGVSSAKAGAQLVLPALQAVVGKQLAARAGLDPQALEDFKAGLATQGDEAFDPTTAGPTTAEPAADEATGNPLAEVDGLLQMIGLGGLGDVMEKLSKLDKLDQIDQLQGEIEAMKSSVGASAPGHAGSIGDDQKETATPGLNGRAPAPPA